jgi:hypothetical protein
VKDLNTKNYDALMKETGEDTKEWKIAHVHRLKELVLLNCSYYPKQFTYSMQFLSKSQSHFL